MLFCVDRRGRLAVLRLGVLRDVRAEAVYFYSDIEDGIEFVQVNQFTVQP